MNYYKHYIGDFQRDTNHLSLTERGAYLSLIHHYYATEKPLPNNIDSLCRIAGAVSPIERKAVKAVMCFFDVVDSGLMHSRIEAEIQKSGEQSNTNRDIALAREAKRRAEKEAKNNHEKSTNRAQNVPQNEHEKSTNHTPVTNNHIKPNELTNTVETGLTTSRLKTVSSVCLSLKNLNITGVNPTNPTFLALLDAGATPEEFTNAAESANVKKFNYVLAIVKGQREAAKDLKIYQGQMPKSKKEQQRSGVANSIFGSKQNKQIERDITNETTITD